MAFEDWFFFQSIFQSMIFFFSMYSSFCQHSTSCLVVCPGQDSSIRSRETEDLVEKWVSEVNEGHWSHFWGFSLYTWTTISLWFRTASNRSLSHELVSEWVSKQATEGASEWVSSASEWTSEWSSSTYLLILGCSGPWWISSQSWSHTKAQVRGLA